MRIFYYLSHYISHRLAGLAYVGLLRGLGHTVAHNLDSGFDAQRAFLEDADLVVLHQEPTCYAAIYEALPILRVRFVAAYAVWENETLTPEFIAPLQRVQTVWTCSEFCRAAIAPHVRRCSVLPHMAARAVPAAADLAWAEGLLAAVREAGAFVFLSVIDAVNPRKNLTGLLTAFNLLRARVRRPVRLLLKQYRLKMDFGGLPDVINVTGELADGRMAALYTLCDAYVSAHHAEGWGLGLSEAMSYGKPVIATGYSGNMEFMDASNSFPLPFVLAPVSTEQCERLPLFKAGMRWAEVDMAALAATMRRVAEGRYDAAICDRAAGIAERFGPARVSAILTELLASCRESG